jgi:hypothetical protein
MPTRRQFLAAGVLAGLAAARRLARADSDAQPDGSSARGMITPEAQQATDLGLEYLVRHQHPDGSFGTGQYSGNVAITSLAALAFMAGGHQPGRGAHGKVVRNALEFVLDQEEGHRGYLHNRGATPHGHGPMYGHGFGTLFLGEVYGMVPGSGLRDRLRGTLKRAVELIIASQNSKGGWRYTPESREADISVTICQIMALRSARNAGFSVPKETVDRCIHYVKSCQEPEGGFRYMDQGGVAAFARTAAGVVALYSAGIYHDPAVDNGLRYLMTHYKPGQNFPRHDIHYFYGHYYAAQAMWTAGGSYWTEWFPAIREELIGRTHRFRHDGSWTDQICPHYATAMACIILQIPNNYLPILQK